MFAKQKQILKRLAVAFCIVIPAPLMAGSLGDSAVRDGAVTNTRTAQPTVPCERLGRNIPASLAAEMDCGSGVATPRVAGERVRNTGGLFGGHNVGSAPAANSDDDEPVSNVATSSDPTDDGGGSGGDGGSGDDGGSDGDGGSGNDGGDGSVGDGGSGDDGGDGSDGDGSNDDGSDDDSPNTVGKFERLADFGINRDNLGTVDQGFKEQLNDFIDSPNFDGDFSDFNPTD
ncbi:MAG: hypothetical protein AAF230_06910 [Pseudomonadota bacterium]